MNSSLRDKPNQIKKKINWYSEKLYLAGETSGILLHKFLVLRLRTDQGPIIPKDHAAALTVHSMVLLPKKSRSTSIEAHHLQR